ncbi:MAG: aldo/keto reductase, partial [Spirochaetota bacterium]
QYSLLVRTKVEKEFARLYEGIGLGLTTFSPLASGLLSGKYKNGIPKDSRFALPGYEWLQERWYHDEVIATIENLRPIAESLGCTMSQLALAWVARNPNVSTVITGASRLSQLEENLGALDVLPKLTPDVLQKIDKALEPILQKSS